MRFGSPSIEVGILLVVFAGPTLPAAEKSWYTAQLQLLTQAKRWEAAEKMLEQGADWVWLEYAGAGKFCYDLMTVDARGSTLREGTSGRSNSDYRSFGADLFAAADGVVEPVTTGARDQEPGKRNGDSGNGRMGNTGASGGPHLHFRVWGKDGVTLPFEFPATRIRAGGAVLTSPGPFVKDTILEIGD